MPTEYTYVLIASGRRDLRRELQRLLARMPEVLVVGEAEDAREMISRTAELLPQVVLMDIALPGTSGIEAIRRLTRESPEVKILIVTSSESVGFMAAALRSGASGYCLISSAPKALETAIRSVAYGAIWLDGRVSPQLLERLSMTSSNLDEFKDTGPS